jgi:hypothetical protein
MVRSSSRLRRAGLAAAVLLLLGSPSLPAAGLFDCSQPGFLSRVWAGLFRLWDKEGSGLDPNGRPDAGGGLDPSGSTNSSDEGPGLDPDGIR